MLGYYNMPEQTAAAIDADGWLHTGDLALRLPNGYYKITGRIKDMICRGGENIYPREIEEFLAEQPGVTEAAVAGVADPVRGEIPVAYVVCEGTLDRGSLEAVCREHLASFKIPRDFVRVDKLPRTALGKIQKHLLPAWTPQ
jgi:acyl-CoA synthetase (AMP-forming)/AMP-acid ligase II